MSDDAAEDDFVANMIFWIFLSFGCLSVLFCVGILCYLYGMYHPAAEIASVSTP